MGTRCQSRLLLLLTLQTFRTLRKNKNYGNLRKKSNRKEMNNNHFPRSFSPEKIWSRLATTTTRKFGPNKKTKLSKNFVEPRTEIGNILLNRYLEELKKCATVDLPGSPHLPGNHGKILRINAFLVCSKNMDPIGNLSANIFKVILEWTQIVAQKFLRSTTKMS